MWLASTKGYRAEDGCAKLTALAADAASQKLTDAQIAERLQDSVTVRTITTA